MSMKNSNMMEKTTKLRKISQKEQSIIKELIKEPRISDKEISQNTGIPVNTVNRKRKIIEKEKMISYFLLTNNYNTGTKVFNAQTQYIIYFDFGVTKDIVKNIIRSKEYLSHRIIKKHVFLDYIGDKQGQVIYTAFISSRVESDMAEILNAEIVPIFEKSIGKGKIKNVEEISVRFLNKMLHNYYDIFDAENQKPYTVDNDIFVSD